MMDFFHRYKDMPAFSTEHTTTTLICLVSDMLLVTGSTQVDPTILSLKYYAKNGESIVLIILSETLNGLDAYRQGSSIFLQGYPRLLYMWLLEHFCPVGFNLVRLDNPTHFFCCPIFSALTMFSSAWTVWFSENF